MCEATVERPGARRRLAGPIIRSAYAGQSDHRPAPPGAGVSLTALSLRVARVSPDSLNLRAGPGIGAAIVGRLAEDMLLRPLGLAATVDGLLWVQVQTAEGMEGWAAGRYLELAAAPLELPSGPEPHGEGRQPFDPTTPTELQRQDWTCAIRATMWMLKSLGVAVTPEEAQDAMSPQYVRSDVGLLDATGAGIVAVLRERWGVRAFNRSPVTFDAVAGWAGRAPVAMGGRAWNHWTAVRGYDAAADVLVLANPGGTGPRYGQQTLNRQQFEALGWFSAVVAPVE
ncbi:MAG: SH3 domain-containing protein [Chloroflexi bacterium]|nr:SH3 domain-containing protein [Chloroflexota bacterium]